MKFKTAIKKIIAPALEKCGFSTDYTHNGCCAFYAPDESMQIEFDITKYSPKRLRTFYTVYTVSNEVAFRLNSQYLKPEFCPRYIVDYSTQEEFEQYLEELKNSIVELILPYMETMKQNYVLCTYAMNQSLAVNTAARARRFANKWGCSFDPHRKNLVRLDEVLEVLRPAPTYRREAFQLHEDEIIDMASYFGELLTHAYGVPGQWYWREISGNSYYVIKPYGYDPLERTICAWNCGHESYNFDFGKYPLAEQMT